MELHRKKFHHTNCAADAHRHKPDAGSRKKSALKHKLHGLKRFVVVSLARLSRQLKRLRNRVNGLSAQVSSLQEQVGSLTSNQPGTVQFLASKLNSKVTIETPAGTLFGTLLLIGEDFIQLREADGSIVLLPLRSVLSVL